MTHTQSPAQQHDEAAWFDLRRRLLETLHSARFAALRWQRPPLIERCPPGVFVAESRAVTEDFVAEALDNGLHVAWVNGERIARREEFLDAVARTLKIPDYFGHNWDAFEECIRDLAWLPARGYVLVLDGYDRFARSDSKNWMVQLDILKEAASTWSRTETPMGVLLQGPRDQAPGVPMLRCAEDKVIETG